MSAEIGMKFICKNTDSDYFRQGRVIYWYTTVLGAMFVLSTYDPLKGALPGDPKHYPESSKPEKFKKTRFHFSEL